MQALGIVGGFIDVIVLRVVPEELAHGGQGVILLPVMGATPRPSFARHQSRLLRGIQTVYRERGQKHPLTNPTIRTLVMLCRVCRAARGVRPEPQTPLVQLPALRQRRSGVSAGNSTHRLVDPVVERVGASGETESGGCQQVRHCAHPAPPAEGIHRKTRHWR